MTQHQIDAHIALITAEIDSIQSRPILTVIYPRVRPVISTVSAWVDQFVNLLMFQQPTNGE